MPARLLRRVLDGLMQIMLWLVVVLYALAQGTMLVA